MDPHTELDRFFFFFSLKLFSCCGGSVVPLLCSQGTVLDRHGIWQQALSSLLSVAALTKSTLDRMYLTAVRNLTRN